MPTALTWRDMKEKIGFVLSKRPIRRLAETFNIQRRREDDGGPCSVMAVDARYVGCDRARPSRDGMTEWGIAGILDCELRE